MRISKLNIVQFRISILLITTFLSVVLSETVRSQDNASVYESEKIYLQLDGNIYTTDKTVWFKCVVVNASDHTPTKLSGVLYVELIGPSEKILEKKLIKLDNGIGAGFFDLNQGYSEGTYLIRAYTEWNRNFGSDFFFHEYIQVFTSLPKVESAPINDVSLIEIKPGNRHLTAIFDPTSIDTLHKKELTVIVTKFRNADTLSIERNSANKYAIDLDIPDSCQFVTIKMITKNKFSFTKTIVLDEDHLDLQFFPESGELVNGITSRVGFKALDYNGTGKSISGEIIDEKGTVLTVFKSNLLGMGSFILENPKSESIYFARLKTESDTNLTNLYPLPKVALKGNVLSVVRKSQVLNFAASSSYMKNDSIYVKATCRGLVYYVVRGKLKDGELAFSLPVTDLPDGIIAFTLIDNSGQPVAERLVFNEKPESRLKIEIIPDKDIYTQRELTKLNIKTSNYKSEPVKTSVSLLIINKEQMGLIQNRRQNILSYFLISSDLNGDIEKPGYYFSESSCSDDLDALMLTQGWRRYLYNKSIDKIVFLPESKLNLSGTVGGKFFTNRKKIAEMTLMTFGRKKTVQTQITDSTGKFYFNLNDEYEQNVNILIQSANSKGIKKDYTISLDKKESPSISFNHSSSIDTPDSIIKKFVEKNVERKKVDDTYKLSGDIQLAEVKVEAYKMTPIRKKVMQEYGKPSKVISGEELQKNEEKWSFGVYSVIQSKYPDINIYRFNGYPGYLPNFLRAQISNDRETLVVIDGIAVNLFDYVLIPNIPPSEISSFEIIKKADNFAELYREFNPEVSPLAVPSLGDVIAIYTYGGNGIYGALKTVGLLKATVSVFSTPREFYVPKYDNLKPDDWYKPDLRALIDWKPTLVIDSLGQTNTSFYNSDNTGKIKVVVEAISENGEVGYKEITYEVKKRM